MTERQAGGAALMTPGRRSLAICICTKDRPELLRACLISIAAGSEQPDEIVVSDDGGEPERILEICGSFGNVTYVRGPRMGLSANRNRVVRAATSTYVSLVDDDAQLSAAFIENSYRLIEECPCNVVFSGDVSESGVAIKPSNPTFWGHFGKRPGHVLRNLNLNCNLLPRQAFEYAGFDETIDYGYEDTDLCAGLISKGFQILYIPQLKNCHVPPRRERGAQRAKVQAAAWARFYTTVKRHLIWHPCYACLLAYVLLAPFHRAAHGVKSGDWDEVPRAFKDIASAVTFALRERSRLRRLPGDAATVAVAQQ